MAHISAYPIEWPDAARQVKDAAGWRCVRCGHPHELPAELGSCAVAPIKFDMARPAKANEIGEGVGLSVAFEAELLKGHDVGNGQFFEKLVLMDTATPTGVIVSMSGLVALIAPAWAVIVRPAALPVGAIFSSEVLGKPFQAALVTAEPLGRFAWPYNALPAAIFALVAYAWFLKMWVALLRAVDTAGVRRGYQKASIASAANQPHSSILGATFRAKNLLLDLRSRAAKHLLALWASLADVAALAHQRTVTTPQYIPRRHAKSRFATFTADCNHTRIIPQERIASQ